MSRFRATKLLLLVWLVHPAPLTARHWLGFPRLTLETGVSPSNVATGDFNGDEITDLAITNGGSNTVSITLGEGAGGLGYGTFENSASYTAGDGPTNVAMGDFNGDGIADLAITNGRSNTVSIMLGEGAGGVGNGTFQAAISYGVGDLPVNVTTGYFDADNITDLLVTNINSDSVSVLLGNGSSGHGDGTFQAAISYGVGDRPNSLTIGDFNGDGITDFATANDYSSDVTVLIGNGSGGLGDGTFQGPVNYSVGLGARSVKSGDFNSDGILDLAVVSQPSRSVSILLGNGSNGVGDGSFQAPIAYSTGGGAEGVTTGDFNHDGITDLATVHPESNEVRVLLGIGSDGMGIGAFQGPVSYGVGKSPRRITTGDFNSDGITDLITTGGVYAVNTVAILLGDGVGGMGNGTFQSAVDYELGGRPVSVAAGDFNLDGLPDLAIANDYSDDVSVLLSGGSIGGGGALLQAPARYKTGWGPVFLITGDFNGDSIIDLATANSHSNDVSVLIGSGSYGVGDGTFQPAVQYGVGTSPTSVATGDLNGDGIADLVTANYISRTISVLFGRGSSGQGDGTFEARVNFSVAGPPHYILACDLNEDGITDIVVTLAGYYYPYGNPVLILLGKGNNSTGNIAFQSPIQYRVGSSPINPIVGDFNGDGIADLAVANYGSDTISLLLGLATNGVANGRFRNAVSFYAGLHPSRLRVDDINGDGITDLISVNGGYDLNTVSILLGNGNGGRGDGTFRAPRFYWVGDVQLDVATGDFDGDGLTDVAATSWVTNPPANPNGKVSLLLNLGFSDVADPISVLLGKDQGALTDDRNGDGIVDAADILVP